ncbi:MAG: transferrin-binding protein-like solute binding protein [Burkholderiales bacterium]|nr:transferrin-binding protein-like solute binding protein [Burkholderiales bacterium]
MIAPAVRRWWRRASSAHRRRPRSKFSGTLIYAAGTNRFDGAVSSADAQLSGNASGRFYGPAAQEIGGIYHLQGAGLEMMMGSFGGIR